MNNDFKGQPNGRSGIKGNKSTKTKHIISGEKKKNVPVQTANSY